jgi:hypothetical protein
LETLYTSTPKLSSSKVGWPNGKALDYESRDCRFDPCVDHNDATPSYLEGGITFARRLALIVMFLTFFNVSWARTITTATPLDGRQHSPTFYRWNVALPQKKSSPME